MAETTTHSAFSWPVARASVVKALREWRVLGARSGRAETWWWIGAYALGCLLLSGAAALADIALLVVGLPPVLSVVAVVTELIGIVPTVSVSVRRMHDVSSSPAWVWSSLALSVLAYPALFLSLVLTVLAGVYEQDAGSYLVAALVIAVVTVLACTVMGVVLLIKMLLPSTPQENSYGPVPNLPL